MITLKPIKSAILTIGHETRTVHRIGSGRYCTAWKNGTGDVWLQVHEKDSSKDILASLEPNPHLPRVERLGYFDGNSPYKLYKSVEYMPLTAKHKRAWEMYKVLHMVWNRVRFTPGAHIVSPIQSVDKDAQDIKENFRGAVEEQYGDSHILDAVDALIRESYNYGAYTIEITKKNCAVDQDGNLILLDPLFDLAEVRDALNKALKRNRGY